ncbi:NAD(P)/FAD-dependent oxidoreductase [Wenzhouxiangella sp. XN79A]|uniref:flavin-containing monooxygenase n=1 Tax=Wenzhouxiangella sp. XN79A TaxID=2724193 RepID=UPI00144AA1FD|nr:NAD(P)/FAD-dependent oxidoreductase [Wenzhouxiangella sp. XN79A]NKI35207.1 NAD(P)/FAD-dependent oxidoreductase [Wenzhouxiangella sp. XN79A]
MPLHPRNDADPRHLGVAILGAGFGGLAMAVELQRRGVTDFRIFEAADGVGGTWWVNRYPGCACDVPAHLYSLSFAPNPDWSRRFAPRDEIQAYLERVVGERGLAERIELGCRVEQARWDAAAGHWRIEDAHGRDWTADVLVSAIGGLSRPAWPDLPGLHRFAGQVIHSQQWPDDLAVEGRRVALVGTGATAAQIVPEIASAAAQLVVYQRSPNWILPRPDGPIRPWQQALYRRAPWLQKLVRLSIWAGSELRVPGLTWSNRLAAGHRALALWHLKRQVPDPVLRKQLVPDFAIGCRRVLRSSDYYPALMRDNVELVTSPIRAIEADGVVTTDGLRRPADLLVLATGFRATSPVPEGLLIGRDGIDLATAWAEAGPEAWRGVAVHGFPNLFLLMGPNTALGHNSVVYMIESQARFVADAVVELNARGATAEVRAAAQRQDNERLQRKLAGSVWNAGGCRSWYLHPASGRNATLWPGFTLSYRNRLRRFLPEAFELSPAPRGDAGTGP